MPKKPDQSQLNPSTEESCYRQLLEVSSDWVWRVNPQGIYTSVSPTVQAVLGYTPEELIGKNILNLSPRDEHERIRQTLLTAPEAARPFTRMEHSKQHRDGHWIQLETNGVPIIHPQAGFQGYLCMDRNITARKLMQADLAQEQMLMRALMDNIPDAIYFKDIHSRFIRVNQGLVKKHGLPALEQVLGKSDFDFFTRDHAQPSYDAEQEIIRTGQPVINLEEEETWDDRPPTWASTTKVALRDKEGQIIGTFGISRDITERKRAEEKLRELSLVDELTGLNNRRGFMLLAAQQLKNADRNGQSMPLIYLDLDKLKWINDHLGHSEGDRALMDTANLLRKSFREVDIIARLGGDEFVVLPIMPADQSDESPLTRLQTYITTFNHQENRPYQLSISIGIAHYHPTAPCTLKELLESADRAMYRQKQSKKA